RLEPGAPKDSKGLPEKSGAPPKGGFAAGLLPGVPVPGIAGGPLQPSGGPPAAGGATGAPIVMDKSTDKGTPTAPATPAGPPGLPGGVGGYGAGTGKMGGPGGLNPYGVGPFGGPGGGGKDPARAKGDAMQLGGFGLPLGSAPPFGPGGPHPFMP